MRVLVFGASGMLGHMLLRVLSAIDCIDARGTLRRAAVPTVLASGADRLITGIDIADLDSIDRLLADLRPAAVINCIAVRAPAPDSVGMAAFLDANAVWPHRLADATRAYGCRLIHISSDGVFSGARGLYTEQDTPDPPNTYCLAKLLGEPAGEHVVTLRTSIIGPEIGDGTGLLSWFLKQQYPISGYRRWMFSGFTTLELSNIIAQHVLTAPTLSGLFHVASTAISKFDLLRLLSDAYERSVTITADDAVVLDRTLDGKRFSERTGYVAPSWPAMIAAMRDFPRDQLQIGC